MDDYIKREAVLMKLMQDRCSAKKTYNPSWMYPSLMLPRWCIATGSTKLQMTEKILVFVITANILLAGFGNKQNTAPTAGPRWR